MFGIMRNPMVPELRDNNIVIIITININHFFFRSVFCFKIEFYIVSNINCKNLNHVSHAVYIVEAQKSNENRLINCNI